MKCKNCTNETDKTSGICEECADEKYIITYPWEAIIGAQEI